MEIICLHGLSTFHTNTTESPEKYQCAITAKLTITMENKDVLTVFNEDHYDADKNRKNSTDVEVVLLMFHKDKSYLGLFQKLQETFPNFQYLEIIASKIDGMSNQDLKYLPKLEYFTIGFTIPYFHVVIIIFPVQPKIEADRYHRKQ